MNGVFSIPLDVHSGPRRRSPRAAGPAASYLSRYIGSNENSLAKFAADLLQDTAVRFNPLMFVGPTGVGKSHVSFGLAARWHAAHPHKKLVSTTGADFARAYAHAIDTDSLAEFRTRFRRAAFCLIDGLDELATKPAAQEDLALTLDELVNNDVRVLVTGRKLPAEMESLSPRLCSRLSAGLVVPFVAPGAAARRILLVQLAEIHEVSLPEPVIDLLADGPDGGSSPFQTVPQLNHAILQLASAAQAKKQPIDVSLVDELLEENSANKSPSLSVIATAVAKCFALPTADLRSASRRQLAVRARGVAMLLARKFTDASLDSIGQHFGGRDHTTVLHACRKTEELLKIDPTIRHAIDSVADKINATPK